MNAADWIGRTESRRDLVTAAPLAALSATLDRDDPPPQAGDIVPLLWHWLYFLPRTRQSDLGPDGHARLGEFLPPVGEGRRMYAGGRVSLHRPLRVGDQVERVSRIAGVSEKPGRNGALVFVKLQHQISTAEGLALVEDHDIVYVGGERPPADQESTTQADRRSRPAGSPAAGDGQHASLSGPHAAWVRDVSPDDVLLFRYSALTFNGYRIHYDRRYATEVQGYPGLVVHAPLIATLLADLLRRNLPARGISAFSFRALRPLFDGAVISLCGRPEADGQSASLWAQDRDGALAFEAVAVLGA